MGNIVKEKTQGSYMPAKGGGRMHGGGAYCASTKMFPRRSMDNPQAPKPTRTYTQWESMNGVFNLCTEGSIPK